MADQDVKMLIERIMAEARTHQSARFSNEIYADEPILKTGRQMQNFLPDQYRKMREISRWQEDPKGGAGALLPPRPADGRLRGRLPLQRHL